MMHKSCCQPLAVRNGLSTHRAACPAGPTYVGQSGAQRWQDRAWRQRYPRRGRSLGRKRGIAWGLPQRQETRVVAEAAQPQVTSRSTRSGLGRQEGVMTSPVETPLPPASPAEGNSRELLPLFKSSPMAPAPLHQCQSPPRVPEEGWAKHVCQKKDTSGSLSPAYFKSPAEA